MLLSTARFAAKAYSTASSAIHTLKHPIQATQDAIRGLLVKVIVKAALMVAGDRLVSELQQRVQAEKHLDTQVRIPEKIRSVVLDEDALAFTTNLVNDALAAPLGVLGLTLGELTISKGGSTEHLQVRGVFRLQPAGTSSLPAPPAKNP